LSVRPDGDLVGAVDHVSIGEHIAVLADDEARAEGAALRARRGSLLGPLALGPARLARDEAPEELEHFLVLDAGHLRERRRAAHRLRGADVHHRVALLLDQSGEIGSSRCCAWAAIQKAASHTATRTLKVLMEVLP
jgi:hypothetical protein